MAQLEKYFTADFSVGAMDGTYHNITGFPAIAANTSVLVTGVYYYFSGTYASNITILAINDQTNAVPVFSSVSGQFTQNPRAIISSNSQFVMMPGDVPQYAFFNNNTGTLSITIFYKLIGSQDESNSIIFGSIKNIEASTSATITIPSIGNNVAFYKSLILVNNTTTDDFEVVLSGKNLKLINIVANSSALGIEGQEYLYQNNQITSPLFVSTGGTSDFSYYLSYYYDPLYTS